MNLVALLVICVCCVIHFGQGAYAIDADEGARAPKDFWKGAVAPALDEAFQAADDFGRHRVGPALAEATEFAKSRVAPALNEGFKTAGELGEQALDSALDALEEAIRKEDDPDSSFEDVFRDWVKNLPEEALKYAQKHPYKTAMHITSLVTILSPRIVAIPLQWVLGFGAVGIRTGTAASAYQSVAGRIGVKSVFSYMQSSAMGGYGFARINNIVRVGAGVLEAAWVMSANEQDSEESQSLYWSRQSDENGKKRADQSDKEGQA